METLGGGQYHYYRALRQLFWASAQAPSSLFHHAGLYFTQTASSLLPFCPELPRLPEVRNTATQYHVGWVLSL